MVKVGASSCCSGVSGSASERKRPRGGDRAPLPGRGKGREDGGKGDLPLPFLGEEAGVARFLGQPRPFRVRESKAVADFWAASAGVDERERERTTEKEKGRDGALSVGITSGTRGDGVGRRESWAGEGENGPKIKGGRLDFFREVDIEGFLYLKSNGDLNSN